jgi:hypothetical protein
MAGQITTKTFKGGMNKDIDVSLLQEDQYRHAENYKLIADEGSNSFVLETAEGNALWVDVSDYGVTDSYYLVGHCFIKPYLVLFYTTNLEDASPTAGNTRILRLLQDGDEVLDGEVIFDEDLPAQGNLTLSTTYPISAVGYYEAPDNIKVYWTDGYNPVRVINIMDPELSTYSAGMFDIVPDFPLSSSVQPRPSIEDGLVSGNLQACSVQYAYQYYLKGGVQTLWSPASPIRIVPRDANTVSFADNVGAEKDEFTAYGVRFTISIPSENLYSYLRVIAIEYREYNATPLIRVIGEYPLETATTYDLSFTDTGDSITELTYDEYAISSDAVYRAKDLAVKDNRLFIGNIHEYLYDLSVDTRAYRFNSSSLARVYESNLTSYLEFPPTTIGYATVPVDHDAINRFNSPNYEATDEYIYQADGSTLGAEGLYVRLGFSVESYRIDNTGYSSSGTTNITAGQASSYLQDTKKRSYHRNEVYRVGIVFRNNKMQTSPVKWVCDLKMPNYIDSDTFGPLTIIYRHVYGTGSAVWANPLGISATWKSDFSSTGASTWELVYVPREENDRSILGQGLLQPTISYSSGSYYGPEMEMETENTASTASYNDVTLFMSPEVLYNKTLEHKTNDYYQKVGYFNYDSDNDADDRANTEYAHYKVGEFNEEGELNFNYKLTIDYGEIIPYNTNVSNRYSLSTYVYTNYNQNAASDELGPCGTVFATDHAVSPGMYFINASRTDGVPVVNYKRNVFANQYGGPSYLERQYNVYTSASDLSFTDTILYSREGDTFIDFFHYHRQFLDLVESASLPNDTTGATFMFPVESSINTRLSHSTYLYNYLTSDRHRLMQEIAGTWESEVDGNPYILEQELPLYQYNTVYSQIQRAELHVADNDWFDNRSTNYPVRILSSEKKANNETLDSFTQFLPNNFLDLDGSKGQIQNLRTFGNNLFFWQDTGFGIASVNRQSLIQDNNPGILALGTGGVLDRFDYISDDIGNQNQFGIASSRKALYWFDNNKNEFFKYSRDLQSISKIKGVQTWLNGVRPVGDVHAIFDEKYNDIVFTITPARLATVATINSGEISTITLDSNGGTFSAGDATIRITVDEDTYRQERQVVSDAGGSTYSISGTLPADVGGQFYLTYDKDDTIKETITYNEIVDKFVSYNTFTPRKYIKTDSAYYSTDDLHDLWRHNDDSVNRSTYYGSTSDSVVTTSFNHSYPYTKVWDTFKWVSESVDSSNVSQFKDTFDTVEIYNDYQNTGDRDLYFQGDPPPATRPTEVARRERTWSMNIPRNIVDINVSSNPDIMLPANWDETQTFKERIRDKYITAKFTYDNTSGNTFSIPFVSAIYRKSVR